ncbi:hypothetical protein M409DRAFT_29208 [Zasmidium cellare ATCC 36951]|uniref:Uncharacterized protein n=1 Tax=Zasmidium cellare ATCC 36951 TaxID=1080233 RepID=A0A6A6C263_ZASCE|nr:uncharacterized protein M409DRAFT_29208 [Zasmidium cellare ATCC 36951]KAF2160358.1 hypothetical protein M409DRAFT_29208 [Zasmidium cellare ATCC 36951]
MPAKHVLIAGLGRFIKADPQGEAIFGPQHKNIQKLQEDMAKAKADGYEPANIDLDPLDVEDSVQRLEVELKRQKWDIFIVGFGVRANKDFTELFERAINLAVAMQPNIKFGFSRAPDEVFETMKRVLGE